jgi:hypothetical protein
LASDIQRYNHGRKILPSRGRMKIKFEDKKRLPMVGAFSHGNSGFESSCLSGWTHHRAFKAESHSPRLMRRPDTS